MQLHLTVTCEMYLVKVNNIPLLLVSHMKVQESQEVIDGAIHACYTRYYCRSTQCPTSSLSIIKQKQTVKSLHVNTSLIAST